MCSFDTNNTLCEYEGHDNAWIYQRISMEPTMKHCGVLLAFITACLGPSIWGFGVEQTFIPNSDITDCFVNELVDVSQVECALNAARNKLMAFTYIPENKTCYVCLAPYQAGDKKRSQLPRGTTVVSSGKFDRRSEYWNLNIALQSYRFDL